MKVLEYAGALFPCKKGMLTLKASTLESERYNIS